VLKCIKETRLEQRTKEKQKKRNQERRKEKKKREKGRGGEITVVERKHISSLNHLEPELSISHMCSSFGGD